MFTPSKSKKPADRSAQPKKTAVPGAPSKDTPPAARTLGARLTPAFPSRGTPASRSPSANTVNERTKKRNHNVAFPPQSSLDLVQQPLRYSTDQAKDADNPQQAKSRWAAEKFEVIPISSGSDGEADSDDEPLARGRKRRITSSTPSASQQKKPTPVNTQIRDQQGLTSERASLSENITQLRDELAREKEDAHQSAIAKQNEITKLQKLLDDQALKCMKLESAVTDLRRKQESSKETAAKLEASNRELSERKSEVDARNSQAEKDIAKIRARYDHMKEEKDKTKSENDQLQSRLTELQKRVTSQSDEIRECEERIANLSEEVEWYEGNRERMRKEWDERVAMEMSWKEELQALVNNNMSLAERRAASGVE